MRKRFLALLTGALVLVLSAGVGLSVAGTTASGVGQADDIGVGANDNLGSPYSEEQEARREEAQEMLLKGKIGKGTKVAQVGKGRYVELAREDTDKIFVVLVEFGDERNAQFPDTAAGCTVSPCFPGDNTVQRFDGPLHNEIPKPDRKTDNTTLWQSDFDKSHYQDMYFNRMAKYYETQSSGRYSVDGTVTEWVKVPFNQALYGRNYCGGIVCATTKALVRDALAVWVKDQLKTKPMSEVQAYLRSFDEWDRYDYNGNGNFDEPDGFIDHFQIVHAGGDEAAGDPTYGTDAIWSHRWYANLQGGGPHGFTGVNVGANGGLVSSPLVPNNPTGVWVGDYTIQPENGGLGVFAHEFGHDLGLPDLYDTSGNTGGAENSTAFWTLMSSGANIGDGGPNGIGDAPTDLGAWEKFQLGWLDYDVAFAGQTSEHDLGPAEGTTRSGKQGLFVVLPDKEKQTTIVLPKTGSWAYWSGAGDNLSNTMRKSFVLPVGATLSADIWLDTEPHFDYVFLEASTDGTTWTPIKTNLSKPVSDDQGNFNGSGAGMGGSSGTYLAMTTTDPLPSGNVQLRFRYQTDQNTGGKGAVIDNIVITGQSLDGAETETGWTFNGFSRIQNGIGVTSHFNAYVAENRGYRGYDTSLKTAYNFGFLDSRPDWVESYPYQDGLLISYWDSSQTNNNVGDHPGEGLILPVDAHPTFHHAADGSGALLRPRILAFDSTFSKQDTKAITVHINSKATTIPSQKAVDTFDDTKDWWFNADDHGATGSHPGRYQPGWYGVKVPKTGTTVSIKSGGPQSAKLTVVVAPK